MDEQRKRQKEYKIEDYNTQVLKSIVDKHLRASGIDISMMTEVEKYEMYRTDMNKQRGYII